MKRTNDERHALQLYLVNGMVCDLSEERKFYPSVQDVKECWLFTLYKINSVSDAEILTIIENVKKVDGYTN